MAFSSTLSKGGTPPKQLTVHAVCTLDGGKITTMKLDVEGKVPGLDEAAFQEVARQAEQTCPVSNALRNNVQISLNAHLAQQWTGDGQLAAKQRAHSATINRRNDKPPHRARARLRQGLV